jgi:hypothetical protein
MTHMTPNSSNTVGKSGGVDFYADLLTDSQFVSEVLDQVPNEADTFNGTEFVTRFRALIALQTTKHSLEQAEVSTRSNGPLNVSSV